LSKQSYAHPVIALGSYFPSLGIVHSLAPRGIECWVCGPDRGLAARSRFVNYWPIPDPRLDQQGMVDSVLALVRKIGGRPVIFPTDDQFSVALAHNRAAFDEVAIPCIAPVEAVDLVINQGAFCSWGTTRGISCPKSLPADQNIDAFTFPVIAKPHNKSMFKVAAREMGPGETPGDLRFTLLKDKRAWKKFQDRYRSNLDHILVQEFIPGNTSDMYSIGIYADQNSQIKGMFVGRKLRGYPAMYGNTKLGQNDQVDEAILNEVRQIVEELKYTGIAEFEYRRDAESGAFRLIEINPRAWSWIGVTAECAADIPWIAYQDATGEVLEPVIVNEAPGRLKYVAVMSDLTNVLLRYRWDYPAWVMGLGQWRKSLKADKLVIVEFNRRDWPVTIFCFRALMMNGFRMIKHKFQKRSGAHSRDNFANAN
jgi:D-aspartate ligase